MSVAKYRESEKYDEEFRAFISPPPSACPIVSVLFPPRSYLLASPPSFPSPSFSSSPPAETTRLALIAFF